jgi:hypothetical protein
LAADPEVRIGSTNPEVHFQQNLVATHNLLEHNRKTRNTSTLVFTSTSTVYGEPAKIPTLLPHHLATAARKFTVLLEPAKEGGFIVKCLELQVASQGETREEALKDIKAAI